MSLKLRGVFLPQPLVPRGASLWGPGVPVGGPTPVSPAKVRLWFQFMETLPQLSFLRSPGVQKRSQPGHRDISAGTPRTRQSSLNFSLVSPRSLGRWHFICFSCQSERWAAVTSLRCVGSLWGPSGVPWGAQGFLFKRGPPCADGRDAVFRNFCLTLLRAVLFASHIFPCVMMSWLLRNPVWWGQTALLGESLLSDSDGPAGACLGCAHPPAQSQASLCPAPRRQHPSARVTGPGARRGVTTLQHNS